MLVVFLPLLYQRLFQQFWPSQSPLIGLGAGVGSFTPIYALSVSSSESLSLLNFNDAYSLFFRGVIEYGILFICLSYRIVKRYLCLILSSEPDSRWFFCVGFCLLVGCFIKQPILPSSLVFCSIYILIITPSLSDPNAI